MKKVRAFTFIEIMIAIAVFSIGVLAVLRLVTQNLVSMDKTGTRTVATFLAKEWLELVYNIRDANLQKWLPRNCLLTDQNLGDMQVGDQVEADKACARYFSSGADDTHVLNLWFVLTGYFIAESKSLPWNFTNNFKAFRLSAMTWNIGGKEFSRYGPGNQEWTWDGTAFGRYILFKAVQDWEKLLPISDILKVESHVLFIKGTTTGEIVLESMIWKQ